MSHRAYTVIICIIGFLASVAFAVLKMLNIVPASWWAILFPIAISAIFTKIEYDDYQKMIEDEVEVEQQLKILCNFDANAELITKILNADAQGKVVLVTGVQEEEVKDEEEDQ